MLLVHIGLGIIFIGLFCILYKEKAYLQHRGFYKQGRFSFAFTASIFLTGVVYGIISLGMLLVEWFK